MTGSVAAIPLAAVRFTSHNPRTDAEVDLAPLVQSLAHGLVTRPTFLEIAPGVFEVLTGERRVRAAQQAGWTEIAGIIEAPHDPITAHTTRMLENMHRRDVGPVDEARALKLSWLLANVVALGQREPVCARLGEAGSVAAAVVVVEAALADAGWSNAAPAVSQETYLKDLGLGLSTATLRKKLQLLNLDAAVQAQAQAVGLTAAAIRSLMRLSPADQAVLIAAIVDDPALTRQVRAIVEGVMKKGRSLTDAIAIAQGRVPGTPVAALALDHVEEDATDARAPGLRAQSPDASAPALVDDQAAMDAVLPVIEAAQQIQTACATLAALLVGQDWTGLPEPWGDYAREAAGLVRDALGTLPTF